MINSSPKAISVFNTLLIVSVLLLSTGSDANCQVLKDKASADLVKTGVDAIYSLKFETADSVYKIISGKYPGHPVNNLYKALTIYWKNFPLLPASEARSEYEAELKECIKICESKTDPGNEAEFNLANMSARGLLLLFYSDNDLSKDVIPLASSTYKHLRQAFYHTDECIDLYYFTGLYNYYRDAYPRIYPVYRAVAFLFPPGNSEVGLTMLEKSARGAFVLGQESYFMLHWIYMHYENNYSKSIEYISILKENFSGNDLYRIMYLKNLLLLKRYDEAERIINSSDLKEEKPFYSACAGIFRGLIMEKLHRDDNAAQAFYKEGISALEFFGAYGAEFMSYAYSGLSRIEERKGNRDLKKTYNHKANVLADFKKINFDD